MWNAFFKIQPLSCWNCVDSRFSYFSLDPCRSRLDLHGSILAGRLDLCRSRLDPSRSRVDLCRSNQNHENCFIRSTDITDGFKLIYDISVSRFLVASVVSLSVPVRTHVHLSVIKTQKHILIIPQESPRLIKSHHESSHQESSIGIIKHS